MDPDRKECQCELQSEDCLIADSDYQNFIRYYFEEEFMNCVHYEQGLLIDIQSHENSKDIFEIGYLQKNQEVNYNFYESSIRQMASLSDYIFDDLIHGFYSLGKFLENKLVVVLNIPV